MDWSQRTTIVGVFSDRAEAQRAINELRRANFREEQLGVLSPEGRTTVAGDAEVEQTTGSKVVEGAGIGAATGAGVGALWALGIAAGVLPAIGPVVAGGLLISVLASAGGAAAVGSVVGALVGLGVPEEEATYYETEFKAGRTLVTVAPEGRYDEAWRTMRACGARELHTEAR